jgi:ligand-binding sensor domain-containing protein
MVGWTVVACVCAIQVAVPGLPQAVPDELQTFEARAIEATADGALWIGGPGGLARLDGSGLTWITSADGALPEGIADLQEISGALWATGPGGAAVRGADGWERRDGLGSPAPRVVFGVSPGRYPGEVWFATSSGAIRQGQRPLTLVAGDGLPHAVVHDVVVDTTGRVWILCRTGLAVLRDGALEVVRTEANFRAGLIGPDGAPWLGTSEGLLRWSDGQWVRELPGVTPYPRLVASDGSVWSGSASSGLLRRAVGSWSAVPLPGHDGVEVFDVAEAHDGSIWVATATGVVRLAGPPEMDRSLRRPTTAW